MFGLDPMSLAFLAGVAILAGIVRGFAGFGTALIYVPLASLVLPPLWLLVTLTVMDLVGPLPNVPRALRDGRLRDVALLAGAAVVTVVLGLALLSRLDPVAFRWGVAILCLGTVALMMTGWRWRGRLSSPMLCGIGAVSGFLGGLSGLAGPPVLLTYVASPYPARTIRATILLYLVAWDLLFGAVLFAQGQLDSGAVLLGAALILPYMAANVLGARLFDPAKEGQYRAVAYVIITGAALMSVPLWG
ncbi:MAG: sulfite exporter TauE/SafE family protein [Pseudomonadota bacterium]